MSKLKINIWGRDFELPLIYKTYSDNEIKTLQKEAVELFLDNAESTETSLTAVKEYVLATASSQLTDNKIENIFKYVMPKSIYVPQNRSRRVVAIMCNYKFDMEHGMAVVFENGTFKTIGEEDIVL